MRLVQVHRLMQVMTVVGAALILRPFMAEALPANAAPCQATVDTWRLAQSVDQPGTTAPQPPGTGGGITKPPEEDEAPREGGRVQDPNARKSP